MTYCLSCSGTAKFSWSIQLDWLLSACNAGLRLFWFSSAMEILMGSFKLISASRVTPKPQKMKNTWGPISGAAGGGGDIFTNRTANAIPVKNKEFMSHASNTERTLPHLQTFQVSARLSCCRLHQKRHKPWFSHMCYFTWYKCLIQIDSIWKFHFLMMCVEKHNWSPLYKQSKSH